MPFPTVPDKHRYLSAYRPAEFPDALRADGWEPTSALRDEGTSRHYLPADAPAVPDRALTGRFADALSAAGIAFTTGATVTTDAPYRTTAEEIRLHRANGVRAQEMEAAALFALGQVRGLPVASAVVIDGVPDQAGTAFRIDRQRADRVLRELLPAAIAFLAR